MRNRTLNILRPLWLLWGGLGGYRGHQIYNNFVDRKKSPYSYVMDATCSWIYFYVYFIPPASIIGIYGEAIILEKKYLQNKPLGRL